MKQILKIISLICVAAILVSASGCFSIEVRVKSPVSEEQGGSPVPSSEPAPTLPPVTAPQVTVPEQTTASEYTTAAPVTQPEPSTAEKATEKETEKKTEETTAAQLPTDVPPDELDVEALIEYFNGVLNEVKVKNVGFTKSKLTSILDLQLSNSAANSVVGLVKGALLSEDTEVTKVAKGESSVNVMSPSGQTFVSRINIGNVESIKCVKDGSDYVITANILSQTNPEKTTGVMSDIFDFATVDDVMEVYAPKVGATVAREDVQLEFSDCYAKLTVDKNNKIKSYETYVKGVMDMNNASIKKVITISTDVSVTLASKTEYTDFAY